MMLIVAMMLTVLIRAHFPMMIITYMLILKTLEYVKPSSQAKDMSQSLRRSKILGV